MISTNLVLSKFVSNVIEHRFAAMQLNRLLSFYSDNYMYRLHQLLMKRLY